MTRTRRNYFLPITACLLLLLTALPATAQLQLYPIQAPPATTTHTTTRTSGTEDVTDPIPIPFWEDFSTGASVADTSRWLANDNVRIEPNFGIFPPSINVAVFDGARANGGPYSTTQDDEGLADSLVSRIMDLSVILPTNRNTTYFSFFWQREGLSELPDQGDSLVLQFRNVDSAWVTVWNPLDSATQPPLTDFTQEVINLSALTGNYFHDHFQFRFQNYANLSGSFDAWLIDYILLSQDRRDRLAEGFYFDRVPTRYPTPFSKEFRAVPLDHFRNDTERFIDSTSIIITSLARPGDFNGFEFSVYLTDKVQGDTLEVLQQNQDESFTLAGNVPPRNSIQGGELRRIIAPTPTAAALQARIDTIKDTAVADSALLVLNNRYEVITNDGPLILAQADGTPDTVFSVNFRSNDTVSTDMVLWDYYAYDDGTAEFGVGINQNGGQLAYQYILSEGDVMTHIDAYFPLIGTVDGRSVRIKVWKRLGTEPGDQLYTSDILTLPSPDAVNSFARFTVPTLTVSDTIYIGYEQLTDNRLAVGFDRNTNSFDKVFFNVNGVWLQDSTLSGSLMLRPVFQERTVTSVPGSPGSTLPTIGLYPNPSSGLVTVTGNYDVAQVFDLYGRQMGTYSNGKNVLDLQHLTNGMYIVRFSYRNATVSKRIIINK